MAARLKSAQRLLGYAKRYRLLLAATLVMGVLGFAVIFVFPWLIGGAIDHVVNPPAGTPDAARVHWLTRLLIIGAVTALASSVAAYGRGHLSVKLGNRIIADLRQDLFDHLSRLSLHFYSKERTAASFRASSTTSSRPARSSAAAASSCCSTSSRWAWACC